MNFVSNLRDIIVSAAITLVWVAVLFLLGELVGFNNAFGQEQKVDYDKINCKTNQLYCKILKFNPHIDKIEALTLSNKIYTRAKANKIDPNVALAILLQESKLNKVNTYKTRTDIKEYCDKDNCYKIATETNEAFDLSFAQINVATAKNYQLDVEKLYNNDTDYVLDCFFIILKDKMNLCADLGKESFTCYHNRNEPYRSIYLELVKKYL